MQKRYQLKLYSFAGVYLKTQNPIQVTSEVTFTSKINGGQGECVVELDLPVDNFGEGTSIDHMLFAKIYEVDEVNHPTPTLIFTGFVSKYIPFFSASGEGVRLVLLGLASMLSRAYYKDGSSFTVSHAGADPSAIATAVIDHFNGIYGGSWLSHGANVDSVGTNVTKDFIDQTWLQALKGAGDLADGGWWWMIRENGELYFKDKPATATHTLVIGKNVESAEISKSNEEVVNAVQLRWGGVPTVADYSDAPSIASYGRREKVITDATIGDATTADQRGNKGVDDGKDPVVKATVTVNAAYDLESLHPGETVTILNAKSGSNPFPSNLLITAVAYHPDRCVLTLDKPRGTAQEELADAVAAL